MTLKQVYIKMDENLSLYDDIKGLIKKYFNFLIHFDFKPFKEKQLAYEYHFKSSNNCVNIDIWYEQIFSTPIWIQINGLYVEHIELENEKISKYYNSLNKIYSKSFDNYLKTGDKIYLSEMQKHYALAGKSINDSYLKEISEIIKRHPEILNGSLKLLKINSEFIRKKMRIYFWKKKRKIGFIF